MEQMHLVSLPYLVNLNNSTNVSWLFGTKGIPRDPYGYINPNNSKSMTFTLRGGFFTFWAILAHSVPWLPWHPQQSCKGTIILAKGKLATYKTLWLCSKAQRSCFAHPNLPTFFCQQFVNAPGLCTMATKAIVSNELLFQRQNIFLQKSKAHCFSILPKKHLTLTTDHTKDQRNCERISLFDLLGSLKKIDCVS